MDIHIDACESHDQIVVYINKAHVVQRDNSNAIEVLAEIANYLGWNVTYTTLTADQYEAKHA